MNFIMLINWTVMILYNYSMPCLLVLASLSLWGGNRKKKVPNGEPS